MPFTRKRNIYPDSGYRPRPAACPGVRRRPTPMSSPRLRTWLHDNPRATLPMHLITRRFISRHTRPPRMPRTSARASRTHGGVAAATCVDAVVGFAENAAKLFSERRPVQQRQVLATVGSNYRVSARKSLYYTEQPFTMFQATGSVSDWCTIAEDLRTWLLDESEDHWVPTLNAEVTSDIMTEEAYAAQARQDAAFAHSVI